MASPVPRPAPAVSQALPPRDLRRPAAGQGPASFAALAQGTQIAILGAGVALLGCFLPLVSGVGRNVSIIPTVVNEVGQALIVPLSAAAIALLAWLSASGNAQRRALLGGGVIAIASPWAVFWVLGLTAARQLGSGLGAFTFGADIGVGAIVLAVGFCGSLFGGFVVIRDACIERTHEPQS